MDKILLIKRLNKIAQMLDTMNTDLIIITKIILLILPNILQVNRYNTITINDIKPVNYKTNSHL